MYLNNFVQYGSSTNHGMFIQDGKLYGWNETGNGIERKKEWEEIIPPNQISRISMGSGFNANQNFK